MSIPVTEWFDNVNGRDPYPSGVEEWHFIEIETFDGMTISSSSSHQFDWGGTGDDPSNIPTKYRLTKMTDDQIAIVQALVNDSELQAMVPSVN